MYLIDTSVWTEVFRRPARIDLGSVVELEEVATCLPVLQGFRDDRGFEVACDAMHALPIVEAPLGLGVFEQAVDLYRLARQAGATVRSSVDCLIAVCAVRNGLTLLHHDRDFDQLARVSPLRARDVLPRREQGPRRKS